MSGMRFFDTHCHYADNAFDADIDQYIELEVVRENTSSVLTVEDANSLNGVMIGVANNDFEGDRV